VTKKTPAAGKLYGVGVGPGDSELLTLKALRVLAAVPVIFVPQKEAESESLARAIITRQIPGAEGKITGLVFPMVRDETRLAPFWERAAETIWQRLESGQDCALVNVGDPLLYGTFIHILKIIQKKHPQAEVEVVPGVSSVNAASAAALFPLASRDQRIAIVSAERDAGFIRETLEKFDTVVFMKPGSILDQIIDIVEEMGLTGQCVYVQKCSTPEQEIVTDIRRLRGKKPDYFSMVIVRREKW
jgi:precorrin-2/cobalt-factor-2 C20-methyltransferase